MAPYVTVGLSKDNSITLHKKTVDAGITMAIILGISLLIGTIVLVVLYTNHKQKFSFPPPLPPPDMPIEITENTGGVPYLSSKSGVCERGFYGPSCDRQHHDSKYFATGAPVNAKYDVIKSFHTESKSFSQDSCSRSCDSNPDCIGFSYENNLCTLLRDANVSDVEYVDDPSLYLRSSKKLKFSDRVFLGSRESSFPPRYWMVNSAPGFVQLSHNKVHIIDFFPRYMQNVSSKTGYYSTEHFRPSNVKKLRESDQFVIHRPGTALRLPKIWEGNKIYVLYC